MRQLKERRGDIDYWVRKGVEKKIEMVEKIYEQQYTMYKEKVNRIEGRIL